MTHRGDSKRTSNETASLDSVFLRLAVEGAREWYSVSGQGFQEWAVRRMGPLKESGIDQDLNKLRRWGFQVETLALATLLIRAAPTFDNVAREVFGDKRTRQRKAQALLKPIPVLQEIFSFWVAASKDAAPEDLMKLFGYPQPTRLIRGLRRYSDALLIGDKFYEVMSSSSAVAIAKYTLASLTKRITGGFHDREVAAVTGAALQDLNYDETAHRVWRIRNFTRLDSRLSIFPVYLQAVNIVLSERK